ncbi:MAG: RluA family pseudouridine synthase [Treponemataceae bacterium]|nr:MAG: RluA family pseudouridine synthase [Treponemataceae bacterium]
MNTISLTAELSEPSRLDKYVASGGILTRSKLKSCVKKILLNGQNAKLSSKVKNGDIIEIIWEEAPLVFEPQNIPLDILYEDSDVTVINKAQGMVTHPGAGNYSGTLVNALLYHWGRGAAEDTRPGIVHRLDKDTSGALIAAKTGASALWLTDQFASRRVKKEYIAIVTGRPPAEKGKIKTFIARDTRNRKKFSVVEIADDEPPVTAKTCARGKLAVTLYRCIARYGPFSLLRIRIKTGRTHQIRVHLKHIGCPVLGDSLYGSKSKVFPGATLMLHARKLSLRLPNAADNAESFTTFAAPVPVRFRAVIQELRQRFAKQEYDYYSDTRR